MAVSDRSAAGCWLGSTDRSIYIYRASVFQILEQISTIFISADFAAAAAEIS